MKISENVKDAAIYVGTYGKYNNGSLFGKWLKLSDYADKSEFYKACAELHKDEKDPEFMFQDWEYIPDNMVGESWVSEKVWELFALEDDDIEIISHYVKACYINIDDYETIEDLKDEARNCYMGYWEDIEDLGREMAEMNLFPNLYPESYSYKSKFDQNCFDKVIAQIENYFDFEAYGQSYTADWYEDENYYFDTNMR